jgi:ATP-binding cassette, subfamily C (CFTR/MRP), member 1
VLLDCFKRPVAAAILPRLFLITFRYSQPVLINISVRYISNAPKERDSVDYGRWLIVGAFVVYIGLAVGVVSQHHGRGVFADLLLQVSKAAYQHQLNRLQVMTRGALISLIYHRSLNVRNTSYEDGKAVTLMSTDVDNVQEVGEMFHETWAQILEVIIGTSLLSTQIGWLWPIPLVIIVCKLSDIPKKMCQPDPPRVCSRVSRYVATHLSRKQRDWTVATQKRISMTVSMLASAKSIKMLGVSDAIQSKVQELRLHEIAMSKKLGWMMVGYNSSGM